MDDERLEAEGEVAVARLSIDSGDLRHAAAHLGNALTAAPQLPDAYEALAELAVAAGGPAAALELFSAEEPYIGAVACIAHLHAAAGHWDSALPALASVIGADPERPWAEVAWLADPDLPGRVPPDAVTQAVAVLVRTLPDPLPPRLREGVGPFYALVRACAGAHPGHSLLHTVGSTLARRFGDSAVAVAWAEHARDLDPGHWQAVVLGGALRAAGRRDEALAVWEAEIARDPSDVDLYVDVAELHRDCGRPAEGLAWLDRGLAVEPDHPKALPASFALRHAVEGGTENLLALSDHLRSHPEHGYAAALLAELCEDRPWLGHVHPASEASVNVLHQMLANPESARDHEIELLGSALEAPSTRLAVRMGFPNSKIDYQSVAEPDPRVPQYRTDTPLWLFEGPEGLDARPALDPPSARAAELLRDVAEPAWPAPVAAYDHAVRLSGLDPEDLLAVCVHPPLPREDEQGAYLLGRQPEMWVRAVQTFACLGLAHHRADEPWADSRRRALLLDLLFGPEDWTNEAAGFALLATAWADPDAREDVGARLVDRMMAVGKAWRERDATSLASLCRLVLACPWLDETFLGLAEKMLKAVAEFDARTPQEDEERRTGITAELEARASGAHAPQGVPKPRSFLKRLFGRAR
ncbi:tetratricopeptide repeat protein [Streptomyces sp. NRRL F-2747]|uniref:tetratricopeptide repeat protein n=1 Tax=Streptomyces sp. NRRL F-2747 TaxID=1463843 RepID=UPI0006900B69|nr:tetratricopeptide repeat protein [Streptomyces sp. NRRL F-2747]